ncbi:MAG: tRNA (adenosine(37)-N6)-dimethylallyltransferase MiaA [Verrucomicrobia bacterium]|jgi:tRNA dimethylallyltransferase|nr:tRNA (adenosine(37)-N6)-dimethylallyltransferase MiaA [Verrucomicrobiota bacterium]
MAAPAIHVLTGPTAVGKTEAALTWAERHDAEILSCDSVCVYRGMDIGSAKPTAAQQARVRHHGLDLVAPTERFSVVQFVAMARAAIADAHARGKRILVTGGSGFYLAAFFGPVSDDLPIGEAVIETVRTLQARGPEAVLAELRALEGAALPDWLDVHNPIRVAKALERRLASGRPLAELREEFLQRRGPFADHPITCELLERPDPELRHRIAARTADMLNGGLIEEAEHLLSLNLDPELASARAVGYRATMDWIGGGRQVALEGLAERINLDTWALVRKQRKWFRRLDLTVN